MGMVTLQVAQIEVDPASLGELDLVACALFSWLGELGGRIEASTA